MLFQSKPNVVFYSDILKGFVSPSFKRSFNDYECNECSYHNKCHGQEFNEEMSKVKHLWGDDRYYVCLGSSKIRRFTKPKLDLLAVSYLKFHRFIRLKDLEYD